MNARSWSALLLLPLVATLFAFLLWPLALLAFGSAGRGNFFANYLTIFRDPFYSEALVHSLLLSGAVAAAATMLCLPSAWLLARYEFRGKRWLRAGFTLPMSLSGIMVGFLAVIMLGRVGFVPRLAEMLTGRAVLAGAAYQLTGLILAYLYFEIPRGILTLETSLRKFDPQLELAARSLGATRLQIFWRVVLPLIWPALLATFGVTFSVSLGSFGVALILSRRFSVLPLELFHQFTAMFNRPLASAMALTLVAVALAVNYAVHRAARNFHHA